MTNHPKILALLILLPTLLRAEIRIELSVDNPDLTMEDSFTLNVIIRGIRNPPEPKIANLDRFEELGRGSQSRVNMFNANIEIENVKQITLAPTQTGIFTLGPAIFQYRGKNYQSNTVKVRVSKGANPQVAQQSRSYYVTTEVSDKQPFVNEQIVHAFKLHTRVDIANAQLGLPDFNGFWKEEMGKPVETSQFREGVRWIVTEVKTALFPSGSGKVTIPATTLQTDVLTGSRRRRRDPFDDFFFGGQRRAKRVRLRSDPITLNIRPLPKVGRPEGFAGLVGDFSIEAQLSKNSLAVGDSTTLTVTIRGSGNIRDAKIKAPESPSFKIYEDTPELETGLINHRIGGKKTFKWALVPLNEGNIEIPPIRFAYFDPNAEKYVSLDKTLTPLTVTPGTGEDLTHISGLPSGSKKKKVEVLGKDLMPIKRSLTALQPDVIGPQQRYLLFILYFLLPLLYGTLWTLRRRYQRLHADAGYERRSQALRTFNASFKKLKDSSSHEQASNLLREYLGDKFNLDGRALTAVDISRRLQPTGLSEERLGALTQFLKDCEAAQYGGGSTTPMGTLKKSLQKMVKQIEKEVRQ